MTAVEELIVISETVTPSVTVSALAQYEKKGSCLFTSGNTGLEKIGIIRNTALLGMVVFFLLVVALNRMRNKPRKNLI